MVATSRDAGARTRRPTRTPGAVPRRGLRSRRARTGAVGTGGKVLILSASMGAGHDGAARELAERLRRTGHPVEIRDYLPMIPLRLGLFIRWFYGVQLRLAPGSYQWHYSRCERRGPVLTVSLAFANLARRRVRRIVRRSGARVVVSTYPLASQVLGTLRAQGRLRTPTVTYMTDFGVHYLWVSRYVDLHLAVHRATAQGAARLSGRPAVATGPLVPDRFRQRLDAESRRRLRAALGLPQDAVVALVVAGSWGVGDVRTTVERLTAGGTVRPLVVCGRNEELREALAALPGVVALGWRTDMPGLMQVADVLVENAGGLTAMEAFASGLPVLSHECLPGHGRDNAEAMAACGVTWYVREPEDLVPRVLALAGEAAAAQRAAAAAVFRADPAVVVSQLARSPDLRTALAAVGLGVPGGTTLAPPSVAARVRRRVALALTSTVVAFYGGTVGVAAATELGMGVATGQTHHHSSVYPVVRLGLADLSPSGQLPARLGDALTASAATVAVDAAVLRGAPGAVRALAARGVTVVNAGGGRRQRLDPRGSQRDLVDSGKPLAGLPGAKPWVFVATRRLNALDLGTSFVADDVLVRPDDILGRRAAGLRGGRIVLVDGRAFDAAALADRLAALRTEAARRGLALRPLTEVLRPPT